MEILKRIASLNTHKRAYIRVNMDCCGMHNSQIIAGYKLLEKQGLLSINFERHCDFRELGLYEHNSIVEVMIDGKILAYDTADGYQSIHRKDIFDRQLDRVDFYFKRSYLPEFHKGMLNDKKIKPLGLNYHLTCKGNPFDCFIPIGNPLKDARRIVSYFHGEKKWRNLIDYKNFEANTHYENYNVLFLTRVWDINAINAQNIQKSYNYLSENDAIRIAEEMKTSFQKINDTRVSIIRQLRTCLSLDSGQFLGGVEDSEFARKYCPDIIVDNSIADKANFMRLIKNNYLCVSSMGLHNSIGWKTGEYVAAGRCFVSEPFLYVITGGFAPEKNYVEYYSSDSCVESCLKLIGNVDKIHEIENNNIEYYKRFLSPDQLILRSLETAEII